MNPQLDPTVAPFHLRFWGVRGSIPTPIPDHLGIGGNTPCMQVLDPTGGAGVSESESEELLIFDGGTGIRALGKEIAARAHPPAAIHIFLTHFHWDHIQGLPYFLPLFSPASHVIFHSAHPQEKLRSVIAAQMQAPYFPVFFEQLAARMEFCTIGAEPQRFGSLSVEAFPLHHPQGSVGFRIVHPGKTVVYATDHEHGDEPTQLGLIAKSEDADVLVYDAQYTPAEYVSRRGWGHSTWLEATRIANQAGAHRLVLFHHDPDRNDAAVRRIEQEANQEFPATHAAFEGMLL
jgi:phosphoribosyl 1,2-cyclic phosphodiesterase